MKKIIKQLEIMTTAEKYRQLEKSPVINIARFIFNDLKNVAVNTTLEKVIAEIKTGKTPSKQEKRYYEDNFFDWFKPDEIGSEKYLYSAKDKVSKYAYETKQATIFEPDTILINAIGDVGRISILKKQASSNQQITGILLKEEVSVDYAYFYLLAHREYFYVDLFQTTLPIVNQKKINTIPFCYPTLEEQKRIVKGLEVIENIKSINDLHIIENLDWKEDYKEICRNFFNLQFGTAQITNELSHQLDLIKQLRQAFLREAMQGSLTPTLSKGEGAETGHELLAKIKAEKAQLIAEKKLKKEKELPPITADEIPFEIPGHWAWCKIGDITTSIVPNRDKPLTFTGDITWVTQSNFSEKSFKLNYDLNTLGFTKEEIVKYNCRVMPKGSIIMSCVGRFDLVCLVEREIVANQQLHCFVPNGDIVPMYLAYAVKLFSKYVEKDAIHTTIKYINKTKCESIPIPLPPLNEQEQIVAKLEELMVFCDGLEESIKESQGYNEKLLQQVLREVLQGDTTIEK